MSSVFPKTTWLLSWRNQNLNLVSLRFDEHFPEPDAVLGPPLQGDIPVVEEKCGCLASVTVAYGHFSLF